MTLKWGLENNPHFSGAPPSVRVEPLAALEGGGGGRQVAAVWYWMKWLAPKARESGEEHLFHPEAESEVGVGVGVEVEAKPKMSHVSRNYWLFLFFHNLVHLHDTIRTG